jgi:signal peptidase II
MRSSLTNTESWSELLFAVMTFAKVRLVRYTVAMNLSRSIRLIILLLVLGGTVGCDQTTKHIARTKLNQSDSVMFMGGLGELQLAENSGAFLSLGDSLPQAIRTLVFTVAGGIGLLAMFGYLLLRPRWHWLAFYGLAMVMAGGASNLIDRIMRNGLVTDFLTLRFGPLHTGVFNVADVLVMLGITLFALSAWIGTRQSIASRQE